MTLLSMKRGQKAKIINLHCNAELTLRFKSMGINLGEEIKLMGRAPFSGPLIIKTLDTVLAFRPSEASAITIVPLGD